MQNIERQVLFLYIREYVPRQGRFPTAYRYKCKGQNEGYNTNLKDAFLLIVLESYL